MSEQKYCWHYRKPASHLQGCPSCTISTRFRILLCWIPVSVGCAAASFNSICISANLKKQTLLSRHRQHKNPVIFEMWECLHWVHRNLSEIKLTERWKVYTQQIMKQNKRNWNRQTLQEKCLRLENSHIPCRPSIPATSWAEEPKQKEDRELENYKT